MKVLYLSTGDDRKSDSWLTLNHEYLVLSILIPSKGPAKLRIIADDNRTPILVDATMFEAISQPLPGTWGATIRGNGVMEIGPQRWLRFGFWEQYFNADADAVSVFEQELQLMMDAKHHDTNTR